MRRGLMKWRQDELSAADLDQRVGRLRSAFLDAGLDGVIAYTTLVRPAAVQYLTGFTPYWSDGLLHIPRAGRPAFVTALSKRVGNWLGSVNPTSEILHSPRPGKLLAERLAAGGRCRLGAIELDMMPGVLVDDLLSSGTIELTDASALYGDVRAEPTGAELRLAGMADQIARAAFGTIDLAAETVGDVTGPLERAVRLEGAEECYVAIARDLEADDRFGRIDGRRPLGTSFAARVSVAYNGVWVRHSATFTRDMGHAAEIARFQDWIGDIATGLDLSAGIGDQLQEAADRVSLELCGWQMEAPVGTRPLKRIASSGGEAMSIAAPYGVLSLKVRAGTVPAVGTRLVLPRLNSKRVEEAAE